jgi:hypothetical protein
MVRICIFAAITAVVLVSAFGCGQQGAGNTPSGSTEQATTSPTESPEPHMTTEETIIAGEESTQATETTEETTAFQAPEGARTSSTARIVCLRPKEEAPPPTKSTEALDDGVLTRVLTPKVEAQPDGMHLQIDNRVGKYAAYSISIARATPLESYESGDSIRKGITNQVIEAPPGIAEIQCYPSENYDFTVRKYAYFQVVAGESGYKSTELECKPGAEITGSAAADIGGYTGSHPVAQAREHFSERLKEGDLVEEAGYPQDPSPPVRVVRHGKVVAAIHYDAGGYLEIICHGQF